MATIRDVAKLAGVSASAVSLVLNNRECRLSEATKRRILQCARELDYENKKMSFKFNDDPLPAIGVIVPDVSNLFYSSLCRACQQEAKSKGYHVVMTGLEEFEDPATCFLSTFLRQKLDGIIYIQAASTPESIRDNICHQIRRLRIPLVTIDKVSSFPEIPAIKSDNLLGGYLSTRHLLELGHRTIGCLTGRMNSVCLDRIEGYKKALGEFNVKFRPELIYEGDYSIDSGYNNLPHMRGRQVTAIFSFNDMMSLGIYRAVRAYGLKIPRDLSIVSYDDIAVTDLIDPPLTSVSQNTPRIGSEAVDLLIRLLSGDREAADVTIAPSLSVRGSTARPV